MNDEELKKLLESLSNKHCKTLIDIFTEPIPTDIRWKNVENLFKALGAELSQGKGSRVRIAFNDVKATFHEPHPDPELKQYTVKKIKQFLENAGISQDLFS